jgi:4-aminobutyrate aminotransferase-like enzyme
MAPCPTVRSHPHPHPPPTAFPAQHGTRYLDCVNNVAHVGHSHPSVGLAVAAQTLTLNTNSRYLHPLVVEASKRITQSMPGDLKVIFWVNSGASAC